MKFPERMFFNTKDFVVFLETCMDDSLKEIANSLSTTDSSSNHMPNC